MRIDVKMKERKTEGNGKGKERKSEGKGKVFEWDEVLDDSGRSDHGVSKLHR